MLTGSKTLRRAACSLVLLLSSCAGGLAKTASTPAAPNPPAPNLAASMPLYAAFMAGNYAAGTGHDHEAAQFFDRAYSLDPTNPMLLHQAFVTALLANSPNAPALARRMGNDPLALMVRGNALLAFGHNAKAAAVFKTMPPTGVTGLIRPLLLAWTEAGEGECDRAIARLKQSEATAPFGPVYALNAAMIAELAGREAEAAPLYLIAERAFPAPNLRLAQALASFRARQGQHQAADAILVRMVGSHPDLRLALDALEADASRPMVESAKQGAAEAYLTLAGSLDQPQQILLRQLLLRFALRLRPDLSAARLLAANLDMARGQSAKAAATLGRIPASDPLYGPAVVQRAQILAGMGKGAAMVPALEALAAAHPHVSTPIVLAADIERDAGHYASALRLYDQALARLGPNPPGSAWAIYYGRAIAEDKSGHWPAAEADLKRALAIEPGQPFVLNYLGYSYAVRGIHLARAQSMIEQALQIDPNEGAIIDSLGYVLLKRGKLAEAMREQIRAVQAAPNDPEVNAHLADIYAAAGNHLAARNQWARALSLHPDPAEAAKIRAALKRDDHGS